MAEADGLCHILLILFVEPTPIDKVRQSLVSGEKRTSESCGRTNSLRYIYIFTMKARLCQVGSPVGERAADGANL